MMILVFLGSNRATKQERVYTRNRSDRSPPNLRNDVGLTRGTELETANVKTFQPRHKHRTEEYPRSICATSLITADILLHFFFSNLTYLIFFPDSFITSEMSPDTQSFRWSRTARMRAPLLGRGCCYRQGNRRGWGGRDWR